MSTSNLFGRGEARGSSVGAAAACVSDNGYQKAWSTTHLYCACCAVEDTRDECAAWVKLELCMRWFRGLGSGFCLVKVTLASEA